MTWLRIATFSTADMNTALSASNRLSDLISMRRELTIFDALNLGAGGPPNPVSLKLFSAIVLKFYRDIESLKMTSKMRMIL
jgi:hypothetical protein